MVAATDVIAWAHLFVSNHGIDQMEHVFHNNSRIKAIVVHDIQ